MSFSVWNQSPPFAEADLSPGEHIYQVGGKWVVTDQGTPTQAQIDAVLHPVPVIDPLVQQNFIAVRDAAARLLAEQGDLAGALKLKGVL